MNNKRIFFQLDTPQEKTAVEIVHRLHSEGFSAFLVGGAVRDRLLNRRPKEVDIATSATPDAVQRLFPRTVAVGAAFGVIVVVMNGINTEVATFRTDGGYQDGRHPDSVTFSNARHDAERRDFTINALFYDPETRQLLDFVNGEADLERGVIRTVGTASQRFSEDALRMLRAIRFAARFRFILDPETLHAIRRHAETLSRVSPERIFEEFNKMLCSPHPQNAMQLATESGLLQQAIPELIPLQNLPQPPRFHPEGNVWTHTLLLLRHLRHPSAPLAWSALLHDVGKAPTFRRTLEGVETFPCHARESKKLAEQILRRFHCSREQITHVCALIENHMQFADVKKMRPATLRRMLARPYFNDELELHRVDCLSSHGRLEHYAFLLDQLADFRSTPPVPPPLLTGRDVLNTGLGPGPEVGKILHEAQELQLNDQLTSRPAALTWLRRRTGR